MIKLNNLNKFFNKGKNNQIHVINNTSLDLPKTGFISFLGQSGSGKSTLFNVIGGLDKFDDGSIDYDELNIDNYNMRKIDEFRAQNIGYIFQNYNLLLEETVYDNLKIALEIIGVTDEDEVDRRIEYTLKAVKMYKYKKKVAGSLSGGEQQRVSIARALLKKSKIILADEPTGNLDSANTIEVMRILKKISEKTLVLLVTHDSNLAQYYSDQIIKISDGKIIDIITPDSRVSLNSKDDNIVYLKEYKKREVNENNICVKIYHGSDLDNFDFTMVEKNGTFYIKSNKKIKLADETNIIMIDDYHKEEVPDEKIEFDSSWYSNLKSKKSIKGFLSLFINPIKSFFVARKRTKFFHFAFFCIGIIFALLNISFVRYNHIDLSLLPDDDDSYAIANRYDVDNKDSLKVLKEANQLGYLRNVYTSMTTYFNVEIIKNSIENDYYPYQVTIYPMSLIEDYEYVVGREPIAENECVIGKGLADKIIADLEYNIDYFELFEIINSPMYNVVGISSKETSEIYVRENMFYSYEHCIYNGSYHVTNDLLYYEYEKDNYSILAGRDLITTDKQKCIMYAEGGYPDEYYNKMLDTGDSIMGPDNIIYEVVGIFTSDDNRLIGKLICNDLYTVDKTIYLSGQDQISYRIVEGNDVINDYEIVIPCYDAHKVGSKIGDYLVVGKYQYLESSNLDLYFDSFAVTTKKTIDLLNVDKILDGKMHDIDSVEFQIDDVEALRKLFSENNMEFTKAKDVHKQEFLDSVSSERRLLLVIMVSLLAISVVYIYFTMRSKMINDIYNIGVYRELGGGRFDIIKKYIVDAVVISTMTTLLGYILFSIIYGWISEVISSLGGDLQRITIYPSTYIFALILYVFNVGFGVLPVALLLRKTPAEIISKYDI